MGKLLIILFIMVSNSALASEDDLLIQTLQQAYADVQYFEANFIQEKQIKHLSQPLISKGTIRFAKNHGMIWEIKEPIWVTTKINPQGIFKTNQFYQNKKVTDVQMKAVAGILTELLSSQLSRIESQFQIKTVTVAANEQDWQATLLAKSPLIKKALKALVIKGHMKHEHSAADMLESNQSKGGIKELQIFDASGNKTIVLMDTVSLEKNRLSQEMLNAFQ